MNARTALVGQLILFVISVAISTYYATILPDIVPTHWNIHGQVDQQGSKWIPVLMMPSLVLLMLVLTIYLPALSPKGFEVTRSGKAYGQIMMLVTGLFVTMQVIILAGTANSHIDFTRWIFAGIFLFFALVGNILGKIKQNFYMGIRTPWTLADERVWTESHRITAHQWFIGGIVGALLTLAGVPMAAMVAYITGMSIQPILTSYLVYRRIHRA